ncbi:MAG TPA: DUF1015 domain-containing protein [Gaiellaceae bacterium]|nr:DUF1015 domain-containing protein [Gaiellaceae bacterium]
MPTVRPFAALRYDPAVAGPLDRLVAPPYDVISDEARRDYLARSPYNVVHLTLPDSEEQAARDLAAWRAQRALVEAPPSYWWVAQDYTGPDGVARTREGFAAAVEAVPYERGDVLPHERTHAGPKVGRLRLLRATRTQLEPIFLLYDEEPKLTRPAGEPDLDVTEGGVRTRVWAVPGGEVEIGTPLLVADGHHRYETAVAFRAEDPSATHTFAILVSARAPGLEIFPTHRVVQRVGHVPGEPVDSPDGGVTLYKGNGQFVRVRSEDDFGPRVVESFRPEGVTYTAYAEEAIATVDRGEAQAAFLLQPVTVEQVARFAHAGETMPQKSTFFYPKLTSGLLLFPLAPEQAR